MKIPEEDRLKIELKNKIIGKVLNRFLQEESLFHKVMMTKSQVTKSPFYLLREDFKSKFVNVFPYIMAKDKDFEMWIKELVGEKFPSYKLAKNFSIALGVGFEETMCIYSISKTLEFQTKKKVDILKVISQGARLGSDEFRKKVGITNMMGRETSYPKDMFFPFLSDTNITLRTEETFILCPASANKKLENFQYLIAIVEKYWEEYFQERFLLGRENNFLDEKQHKYYTQKAILDYNIPIDLRNDEYLLK